MSERCSCGSKPYRYSVAFVKMWEEAMRFFPMYALPEPTYCATCAESRACRVNCCSVCGAQKPAHQEFCGDCVAFSKGEPVHHLHRYLGRRKEWLRATSLDGPIPSLDLSNKDVLTKLKQGQRLAREFRKLLQAQRKKMLKIRTKRFMKKEMKPFKERNKQIRNFLEQAVEG